MTTLRNSLLGLCGCGAAALYGLMLYQLGRAGSHGISEWMAHAAPAAFSALQF